MKGVFILLFTFQLSFIFAYDEYFEKAGRSFGTSLWSFNLKKSDQPQFCDWKGRENALLSTETYVALVTTELRSIVGWNLIVWIGKNTDEKHIHAAMEFATDLGERFKKDETYFIEFEEMVSPWNQISFSNAFQLKLQYLEERPKLYLVKGKIDIWAVRIPLRISSLSTKDCFVLDAGYNNSVFSLCGQDANENEKEFAQRLAEAILKKQHNNPTDEVKNADVILSDDFVLHPGRNNDFEEFFNQFELSVSLEEFVPPETEYGRDEDFEKKREEEVQLFRIAPDNEYKQEEEIMQKPLKMSWLSGKECYVVNTESVAGIQIFVGKTSTKKELYRAFKQALRVGERKAKKINEEEENRTLYTIGKSTEADQGMIGAKILKMDAEEESADADKGMTGAKKQKMDAEEESAGGVDMIQESEERVFKYKNKDDERAKILIHVVNHERVPLTPDFIINFRESAWEYIGDPLGDWSPMFQKVTLR